MSQLYIHILFFIFSHTHDMRNFAHYFLYIHIFVCPLIFHSSLNIYFFITIIVILIYLDDILFAYLILHFFFSHAPRYSYVEGPMTETEKKIRYRILRNPLCGIE